MGRCLPVWPGASCKLARMLTLLLQAQDLVAEVFMCTLTQLRPPSWADDSAHVASLTVPLASIKMRCWHVCGAHSLAENPKQLIDVAEHSYTTRAARFLLLMPQATASPS